MIKSIVFPKNYNTKYYKSHYAFILNTAKYMGIKISYCNPTAVQVTRFIMRINNKEVVIDIRDHPDIHKVYNKFNYYFKYHVHEKYSRKYKKLFPLGAISFLNWKQYFKLKEEIRYECNSNLILNNQRVFGNAKVRRPMVRNIIRQKYPNDLDIKLDSQLEFWKKINNCLVSICVPGARNDMLDRGQWQYMAFGCCTISPYIETMLAHNKKLIPGVHYIQCRDDYKDINDKIEWCKNNRKECIEIGKNAQKLFLKTSTPEKLWKWIQICLKGVKK